MIELYKRKYRDTLIHELNNNNPLIQVIVDLCFLSKVVISHIFDLAPHVFFAFYKFSFLPFNYLSSGHYKNENFIVPTILNLSRRLNFLPKILRFYMSAT
jgi:hypothetical protein